MIKVNHWDSPYKKYIPEPKAKKKEKEKFISGKVKKIMHEGIRGKKVSDKQAVAVAFKMSGEK